MCKSSSYKCPSYNHSWSCPPAAPYLEDEISTYEAYYLIYTRIDLEEYIRQEKKKHPNRSELYIKSNYFYNEMETTALVEEMDTFLAQYEKNYSKKLLLYSGTCRYCKMHNMVECTYDSEEPCRFPQHIQYSMEAVGIEVVKTVINLDLDIEYPSQKYIYLFGLACFK
jgi:predicted metal-binding protein